MCGAKIIAVVTHESVSVNKKIEFDFKITGNPRIEPQASKWTFSFLRAITYHGDTTALLVYSAVQTRNIGRHSVDDRVLWPYLQPSRRAFKSMQMKRRELNLTKGRNVSNTSEEQLSRSNFHRYTTVAFFFNHGNTAKRHRNRIAFFGRLPRYYSVRLQFTVDAREMSQKSL